MQLDIDQKSLIIRRFDEALANKGEKTQIDVLYKYCDRNFYKTDEFMTFKQGIMQSVN